MKNINLPEDRFGQILLCLLTLFLFVRCEKKDYSYPDPMLDRSGSLVSEENLHAHGCKIHENKNIKRPSDDRFKITCAEATDPIAEYQQYLAVLKYGNEVLSSNKKSKGLSIGTQLSLIERHSAARVYLALSNNKGLLVEYQARTQGTSNLLSPQHKLTLFLKHAADQGLIVNIHENHVAIENHVVQDSTTMKTMELVQQKLTTLKKDLAQSPQQDSFVTDVVSKIENYLNSSYE